MLHSYKECESLTRKRFLRNYLALQYKQAKNSREFSVRPRVAAH